MNKLRKLKNKPFGLFIKGQLVAGCYVSDYHDSLHIDQLFVNPIFQNTGLRFGRMILRYIIANNPRKSKK